MEALGGAGGLIYIFIVVSSRERVRGGGGALFLFCEIGSFLSLGSGGMG